MPSTVMTSEPPRWTAVCARAQRYSAREMSVTASAEKVEKVVSPPMKPVMTNSRDFRRQAGMFGKERDRHADQITADQVGRQRTQGKSRERPD